MGLMDLFRRKPIETRSSGAGYTAAIMAASESYITGASGLAELTATVQGCVSLWEAGLSMADVDGTDLLFRRVMAMAARSLALRGEAVFLIRDRLVPASDWDVSTRDGEPRAYRLGIPEAGGGRSETVLAGEVLHFRLAADPVAPWAGQAPLRRSSLSAQFLHEIETALRDAYRDMPLGSQVVSMPDAGADDMATMRGAFRGRRGSTLVVEGVAQAVAAGQHPQSGQRPQDLTPDLQRAAPGELLAAARGSVCMVFGVLPALLNPAATGPAVREAQRHLAQLVLQPIATLMAEEATAKLGGQVKIDVVRPLQAFDAGGRARAFAGMVSALAQAKDAGLDPQTVEDALQFIDWND